MVLLPMSELVDSRLDYQPNANAKLLQGLQRTVPLDTKERIVKHRKSNSNRIPCSQFEHFVIPNLN